MHLLGKHKLNISENYFPISVYTVKSYLDIYKRLNMAYNEKLVEIKMSHLESNINDEKI